MFGPLQAFHEVRFEVLKGEFVNLREPSGCGKTATLIIIKEFRCPPSWSLRLGDEDIGDVLSALRVVPTFESTGKRYFRSPTEGATRMETPERVDDLLNQISLAAHLDKFPNTLSGVQQQRVALARTLPVRPGLVLFEEPLSNLDAKLNKLSKNLRLSNQFHQQGTAHYPPA